MSFQKKAYTQLSGWHLLIDIDILGPLPERKPVTSILLRLKTATQNALSPRQFGKQQQQLSHYFSFKIRLSMMGYRVKSCRTALLNSHLNSVQKPARSWANMRWWQRNRIPCLMKIANISNIQSPLDCDITWRDTEAIGTHWCSLQPMRRVCSSIMRQTSLLQCCSPRKTTGSRQRASTYTTKHTWCVPAEIVAPMAHAKKRPCSVKRQRKASIEHIELWKIRDKQAFFEPLCAAGYSVHAELSPPLTTTTAESHKAEAFTKSAITITESVPHRWSLGRVC